MHSINKKQIGDDARSVGEILPLVWEKRSEATCIFYKNEKFTFNDLFSGSLAFSEHLKNRGVRQGTKVLLVLDNRPEFFMTFFGVMFLGGVNIPLSPASVPLRTIQIVEHSGAEYVVVDDELWNSKKSDFLKDDPSLMGKIILISSLKKSDVLLAAPYIETNSRVPALIQYTSATTGFSKGVVVSHAAILNNISSMNSVLQVDCERDLFSSFLPLYHDMGLVGMGLMPIRYGITQVLYKQDIRSIFSWLGDIKKYKITISGASNTILYLTRRVVANPSEFDLRGLRALIVGSEPIYYDTVKNFESDYGLENTVVPSYGLAETTLCVSMAEPGMPVKADSKCVVSCGRPLPGVDVRVNAENDDGRIGELLVRSPSIMNEYFHNEAETREALRDGFLYTGDIGYVGDDGEIYIIGRKKNIIVRNGENLIPAELEAISVKQKGIRSAAVIGLKGTARINYEDVVLINELVSSSMLKDENALLNLKRVLKQEFGRHSSYLPDRIVFVPPGTIPFSPNGKMQHLKLKEMFENLEIARFKFVEV
jgi:acyl-CoA synthetase (AMP-forming)/AMP-acid ligase II